MASRPLWLPLASASGMPWGWCRRTGFVRPGEAEKLKNSQRVQALISPRGLPYLLIVVAPSELLVGSKTQTLDHTAVFNTHVPMFVATFCGIWPSVPTPPVLSSA